MIHENLCNDGRCKITRMGIFHKTHDSEDNNIEDSTIEGFDDIIIENTRERISQELSNFSSIETKAGIVIAASAAIITFILTPSISSDYANSVMNNTWLIWPLVVGISGFAVSFGMALSLVIPRKKLDLLDPRKMNNEFNELQFKEIKRQIRHNLIQGFEDLQKERNKETWALTYSFIMLGVGAIGFLIIRFVAHPIF